MKKNTKREYRLFFQMPKQILTPFYTEAIIRGGYDAFVFIIEKGRDNNEWYFEKKEEEIRSKKGLLIYSDKNWAKNLIKKGKKLSKEINKYLLGKSKENIKEKKLTKLKSDFKKSYRYFIDYAKIYSYTEDTYTASVDLTIKDFFTKNTKNEKEMNNCLKKLLILSDKKSQRKKIFQSCNATKEIQTLSNSVASIGMAKFVLRPTLNNLWSYIDSLLLEISKRKNIEKDLIKSCLYEDILFLIQEKDDNFLIKIKNICKKRNDFFVAKKDGGWKFYTNEKAKSIIKEVRPITEKKVKEFFGNIANRGMAKGRVVVLPIGVGEEKEKELNKKIDNMKKGDIIVAQATGPEMVPAFKKAGAIICEWGGITSHAAVISREMGIPGIINTKIATQVLKDGDLVEVDANNGVVKILKRAK